MSSVRVYIATSLDGFIAGENDDLSWLPGVDGAEAVDFTGGIGFEAFLADVGALLMGRRTYDVVSGFGGPWPYGERPLLVPTHRPLESASEQVRAVAGDIGELVVQARAAAGGNDVYLDGGSLIRQALDAGLIDDIILTVVPTILGVGIPLFVGTKRRHPLQLVSTAELGGGMVQLRLRPAVYASKRSAAGERGTPSREEMGKVNEKIWAAVEAGRMTEEQAQARFDAYLKSLESQRRP